MRKLRRGRRITLLVAAAKVDVQTRFDVSKQLVAHPDRAMVGRHRGTDVEHLPIDNPTIGNDRVCDACRECVV